MGRKKIEIERIAVEKNRLGTFHKRKVGLVKKAIELSVLCDSEVFMVVFGENGQAFQFSSNDSNETIQRYLNYQGTLEKYDVNDLDDLKPGKMINKTPETVSSSTPTRSSKRSAPSSSAAAVESQSYKVSKHNSNMPEAVQGMNPEDLPARPAHGGPFFWMRAPSLPEVAMNPSSMDGPDASTVPPQMFRYDSNSMGPDSAFEAPTLRRPTTADSFGWSETPNTSSAPPPNSK